MSNNKYYMPTWASQMYIHTQEIESAMSLLGNTVWSINRLDDYVVVSGTYGTPPATASRRVEYNGGKKVVKLEAVEGFAVFDWSAVLENAAEIHMIETCFLYILEKLSLKGEIFNLYSKWNPAFWDHIGHIPKKVKWNFCDW